MSGIVRLGLEGKERMKKFILGMLAVVALSAFAVNAAEKTEKLSKSDLEKSTY